MDETRARTGQPDMGEVRVQDVERTIDDMRETVDALKEKLSPGHLRDEAGERLREATIGRAEQAMDRVGDRATGIGSSIMDTIMENPMPAALTAIGIGWLLVSSRQRDNDWYADTGWSYQPYRGSYGGGYSAEGRWQGDGGR